MAKKDLNKLSLSELKALRKDVDAAIVVLKRASELRPEKRWIRLQKNTACRWTISLAAGKNAKRRRPQRNIRIRQMQLRPGQVVVANPIGSRPKWRRARSLKAWKSELGKTSQIAISAELIFPRLIRPRMRFRQDVIGRHVAAQYRWQWPDRARHPNRHPDFAPDPAD